MRIKPQHTRRQVALPNRFTPVFWNEADGRCLVVKEIKRRYQMLKTDVGADSFQKDLLCQRVIFLSLQLETMETLAAQGQAIDAGVYTQMTNAALGMLKALGLERKRKKAVELKAYIGGEE